MFKILPIAIRILELLAINSFRKSIAFLNNKGKKTNQICKHATYIQYMLLYLELKKLFEQQPLPELVKYPYIAFQFQFCILYH